MEVIAWPERDLSITCAKFARAFMYENQLVGRGIFVEVVRKASGRRCQGKVHIVIEKHDHPTL